MSQSYEFAIKTSAGQYPVKMGVGLERIDFDAENVIFLVDKRVAELHASVLPSDCIVQEALETEKTLRTIENIIESVRRRGGTRNTRLVSVGGGIIQDISTFVASCYMRGIDWIYYPTTFLGMVDSCIGGKSSLNAGTFKNIIGNFYPPKQIFIDGVFCSTLNLTQKIDGLFEAVKISFAHSTESLNEYFRINSENAFLDDNQKLIELAHHSLLRKKFFIEEDEFDRGIRLNLNFGHTFAHAFEGASNYRISHGIAVGLGMLAAIIMSRKLKLLTSEEKSTAALELHILELLKLVPDIKKHLMDLDENLAFKYMESDKKHSSDHFKFILVHKGGVLNLVQLPRSENYKSIILETIARLKESTN